MVLAKNRKSKAQMQASVTKLDVHPTGAQEVVGSTPAG